MAFETQEDIDTLFISVITGDSRSKLAALLELSEVYGYTENQIHERIRTDPTYEAARRMAGEDFQGSTPRAGRRRASN